MIFLSGTCIFWAQEDRDNEKEHDEASQKMQNPNTVKGQTMIQM